MIYLMRHGQDDENYIGGWSDVDLIYDGVLEVRETGEWLKKNLEIKKIICSDVKRAIDTALIVSNILNVSVSKDSNLREQSKGLLNGMLRREAKGCYDEFLRNVDIFSVYPKGESLYDLYLRMAKYLETIFKMPDNTLIVTHRGVINMIYYLLYDIDLDMDKEKFNVTTASIHELDKAKKLIRRIK